MRVARYTAVSIFSILTTALLLQVFARSGMGAEQANAFAVLVAAIPAFALTRSWTWRDRNDVTSLKRQIIAFWASVVIGLLASTVVVAGRRSASFNGMN